LSVSGFKLYLKEEIKKFEKSELIPKNRNNRNKYVLIAINRNKSNFSNKSN